MDLTRILISEDETHHIVDTRPLYHKRYLWVQKFHPPGLAPAGDESGALHIRVDGEPAYGRRFLRTFGYYEDRAAVETEEGWGHIDPTGSLVYPGRFAWVGNFQEALCTVRARDGHYYHILSDGSPAYPARWRFAGDYRGGVACVQTDDGRYTHIDRDGAFVYSRTFVDLDVFHKGYARARDGQGWHHIDRAGRPIYKRRFAAVEPFYNAQARVEDEDGSLFLIDERGETILELRPPRRSSFRSLSADLVGFWRTQTISAAVEVGVFEALPGTTDRVADRVGVAPERLARLLRALWELKLVRPGPDGEWDLDRRGKLLRVDASIGLSAAAPVWARDHHAGWAHLAESLRTGVPGFRIDSGTDWFEWLARSPERRRRYHEAMTGYARHDYAEVPRLVDFGSHPTVLDAGGGGAALLVQVLEAHSHLRGVLFDRPEVVADVSIPGLLQERCTLVGGDLFAPWSAKADAILLARILHDWPDDLATEVLQLAREALLPGGRLYVLEMLLEDGEARGGLLDLNMLVTTGGRERRLDEFRRLFANAGLALLDHRELPTGVTVLIGGLP